MAAQFQGRRFLDSAGLRNSCLSRLTVLNCLTLGCLFIIKIIHNTYICGRRSLSRQKQGGDERLRLRRAARRIDASATIGFGPDLRDDLSAFGGKRRCDFLDRCWIGFRRLIGLESKILTAAAQRRPYRGSRRHCCQDHDGIQPLLNCGGRGVDSTRDRLRLRPTRPV